MAFPRKCRLVLFVLLWVCIVCYIFISLDEEMIYENEDSVDSENELSAQEIQERIQEINALHTIRHERAFGPLRGDSPVIVIFVHDRLDELRHAVTSLSLANGIEEALLIFSHARYNDEINSLVNRIDFCKVAQIFYPYSILTETDKQCADNCTTDVREEKHHWWWQMNRVFDRFDATKKFDGWIVFLNEDNWVATDFLRTLRLLEGIQRSRCTRCEMLNLGSRTPIAQVDFAAHSKHAAIVQWNSGIGMAFRRSLWKRVKTCARTFCTYDDHKWDRSLLAVFESCLKTKIMSLVLLAPRVYPIGEDGVSTLTQVQAMLNASTESLFPDELLLTPTLKRDGRLRGEEKANGGWDDVRDHELCSRMTQDDYSKGS